MENLIYSIPTKVYFGKGQIVNIGRIVSSCGRKALLVYGGGSIKRNGVYNDVVETFKENSVIWCELSSMEPNPRITTMREDVKLCREEGAEVAVPIGGGSTIDCVKVITGAVSYDGDAQDTVLNPAKTVSVFPIVTILALSTTGSEIDTSAIISNPGTNDKIEMEYESTRPKASILDLSYTYNIPVYRTVADAMDIMSRIFEYYSSNVQGYMQDHMAEGLPKTCIEFGVRVIRNPEDCETRANLMWTGSWAINNFIELGKTVEWAVHSMEHQFSTYYGIIHGVRLAILASHRMGYVLNEGTVDKLKDYGTNVWDIDREKDPFEIVHEAVEKTKGYFIAVGIPVTVREVGIKDETNFDAVAEKATVGLKGAYVGLTKEDIKDIYRVAL